MTKYIVTGGAGFIGSHIADALIESGDAVLIIDDLSTGKEKNINPKAEFHRVDIRDLEKIKPFFKGVDGIFHLAALARIQPSFDNPGLFFDVNVVGTRNILQIAKENNVKRVVYSASSSAYGDQDSLPLKEDMRLSAQALNPYSSTKRIGEMLMYDKGILTGGPETVCLRYFNVYGPRQTTTADGPYATVIGIFLDQFKEGRPLTIVSNGEQRRDYTHVYDVVKANLKAMDSSKVGSGEIINVGVGSNYSVFETAALVHGKNKEEMEEGKDFVMIEPRRGEARITLADVSKAKELLDWESQISLEDGILMLKDNHS